MDREIFWHYCNFIFLIAIVCLAVFALSGTKTSETFLPEEPEQETLTLLFTKNEVVQGHVEYHLPGTTDYTDSYTLEIGVSRDLIKGEIGELDICRVEAEIAHPLKGWWYKMAVIDEHSRQDSSFLKYVGGDEELIFVPPVPVTAPNGRLHKKIVVSRTTEKPR